MKTLEIITGLVVGAVVLTYIGYLLVRCLGNCRENKDKRDREEDTCYRDALKNYKDMLDSNRHIYPKK